MAKSRNKKVKKAKPAKKSAKSSPAKIIPSAAKSTVGVTPLGDRVLVMPLPKETMTSFGIVIPDTSDKERPDTGTVVAVGPGKYDEDGERRIPMGVKVGQKVIFSKYGPDEIKIGDKEYYVIAESNILAIID